MVNRTCHAEYCPNKSNGGLRKLGRALSFFRCPRDQAIRNKWLRAIDRPDDWNPPAKLYLCSAHFTPDSYYISPDTGRRIRNKGSVPSVFPNPPHTKDPDKHDHSYCTSAVFPDAGTLPGKQLDSARARGSHDHSAGTVDSSVRPINGHKKPMKSETSLTSSNAAGSGAQVHARAGYSSDTPMSPGNPHYTIYTSIGPALPIGLADQSTAGTQDRKKPIKSENSSVTFTSSESVVQEHTYAGNSPDTPATLETLSSFEPSSDIVLNTRIDHSKPCTAGTEEPVAANDDGMKPVHNAQQKMNITAALIETSPQDSSITAMSNPKRKRFRSSLADITALLPDDSTSCRMLKTKLSSTYAKLNQIRVQFKLLKRSHTTALKNISTYRRKIEELDVKNLVLENQLKIWRRIATVSAARNNKKREPAAQKSHKKLKSAALSNKKLKSAEDAGNKRPGTSLKKPAKSIDESCDLPSTPYVGKPQMSEGSVQTEPFVEGPIFVKEETGSDGYTADNVRMICELQYASDEDVLLETGADVNDKDEDVGWLYSRFEGQAVQL